LVHALRGELARARMLLADGGDVLDRKYLADLAVLGGDHTRAIELYLETLSGTADDDEMVIGFLLDHQARVETEPIVAFWSDPDRRRRTFELLDARRRAEPLRPEVWQRIATLHALGGE